MDVTLDGCDMKNGVYSLERFYDGNNSFPFFLRGKTLLAQILCFDSGLRTAASLTAFSGILIRGKEYMAPCTGLQLMPGTVLSTSSVSLALSAKALRVAVRS